MPSKVATFRKAVIAYTEGLDPKKADKVKGWIEHNGAKYSKEITDDVTHLVISPKAWNNYKQEPMVVEARRKRTIYLMKLSWLEDSLNFNKRKPIDEVNKKYTWEVEHAEKVLKKRKEKQLAAMKEKARALRAEAKEAARTNGGNDQENTSSEDKSTAGKMQQITHCGIKFDKSLLEFERDMALSGYRPYVDKDNLVHLTTLVRNDVWEEVQEHYQIKSSHHQASLLVQKNQRTFPVAQNGSLTSMIGSVNTIHGAPSSRCTSSGYFTVNSATDAHYLDDDKCCSGRKVARRFSDDLRDGHSTPADAKDHVSAVSNLTMRLQALELDAGLPASTFSHWPQHIPFSAYPVTPYTLGIGQAGTFLDEPLPTPRVNIPQPFAYSLQLYESLDGPDPPPADTMPTPESMSPSTFNSSTSHTDASLSPTIAVGRSPSPTEACSSASLTSSQPRPHPSQEKRYALYLHYTKKAANSNPKLKVNETTELAPKGSTWDFAYDMFRKFFRKKTGLSWDEATSVGGVGDTATKTDGRRDSGVDVSLGTHGQGHVGLGLQDIATIATTRKPFTYIPTNTQDLAYIDKMYANRYGEDWLPQPRAVMASSQDGKVESEEDLMNEEPGDEHDETSAVEVMEGLEDERAQEDQEVKADEGNDDVTGEMDGVAEVK